MTPCNVFTGAYWTGMYWNFKFSHCWAFRIFSLRFAAKITWGMAQLNAMMDHQDLPKPLRLRLRSFFLQNRYQAFYLTQQDLLKESLFWVMMISQTCLLEVVRRLLWDAARLLILGHPETSKTNMNIMNAWVLRHLEPEMLGSWWTHFAVCRKWVLNCNPRCQGNLGNPVGMRRVKWFWLILISPGTTLSYSHCFLCRSRSRSLRNHPFNDSQYSRNIWLGHWECLKSLVSLL